MLAKSEGPRASTPTETRGDIYDHTESHIRSTISRLKALKVRYEEERDPNQRDQILKELKSTGGKVPVNLLPHDMQSFLRSLL